MDEYASAAEEFSRTLNTLRLTMGALSKDKYDLMWTSLRWHASESKQHTSLGEPHRRARLLMPVRMTEELGRDRKPERIPRVLGRIPCTAWASAFVESCSSALLISCSPGANRQVPSRMIPSRDVEFVCSLPDSFFD